MQLLGAEARTRPARPDHLTRH